MNQPEKPDNIPSPPEGYVYIGTAEDIRNTAISEGITYFESSWGTNLGYCTEFIDFLAGVKKVYYAVPKNSPLATGLTANLIKEVPDHLPPLPIDYVYLGRGGEFQRNYQVFEGLYCNLNYALKWGLDTLIGDIKIGHYATHKDSEIVRLNMQTSKPTNPNLQ